MSDKNGEECWYALKVFYNRVFELEKQLSQEGVRSYIPLLHEDTVAGDKKIRKRKPAVSSLMFIRQSEHYLLELQDRMKASCPFMAYFDRETKKPAVIPDREMELFMQITSSEQKIIEAIDYRSGDKVRVTGGPFKGAEGYIKRIRGNRRLVVALEGIIAVATTYIPGRFLEKMPEN
jgi:transcription antitermination factor NusG